MRTWAVIFRPEIRKYRGNISILILNKPYLCAFHPLLFFVDHKMEGTRCTLNIQPSWADCWPLQD